jgi:2-methylcitrate dehydratase PrpD
MTATNDLLDFAAAAHILMPATRSDTLRLLRDGLAIGAAGANAPGSAAILSVASGQGVGRAARVLGSKTRLPAASAAFVNGYRIHCLEWDAVHEAAVAHAVTVVLAAVGAAIDRRGGCDPELALCALAVGVDIASGLGLVADHGLRFFRPATAGVIGAALAAARIEGVSRHQFADVLGLAYSQCAGTMQAHTEGSIALPFQMANAARAAITAVDLTTAGFTGPHDALEGPFGYFRLFESGDLARYTASLGEVWRISEISTKPYPCGRASHATLGALADLSIDVQNVARVDLFVPPLIQHLVGRPMTAGMTPSYARLCLPFLVALILADGHIDPRRFEPATFADDRLRHVAQRVTIHVDANPDPNALSPQRVCVTLRDDTTVERLIPHTLGSQGAPMTTQQLTAKYALAHELAGPVADSRLFTDPLAYFTEPQ